MYYIYILYWFTHPERRFDVIRVYKWVYIRLYVIDHGVTSQSALKWWRLVIQISRHVYEYMYLLSQYHL